MCLKYTASGLIKRARITNCGKICFIVLYLSTPTTARRIPYNPSRSIFTICSELESGKEEEDVRTESDGGSSDTAHEGRDDVVDADLLSGGRQELESAKRTDSSLPKRTGS